jgi:hypothetical protein
MIFLEFNNQIATEVVGYPLIQTAIPFFNIPQVWVLYAERIFDIKFGVTKYYKDRFGTSYQFTPEEEVVLRLKAVVV